MPSKTTLSPSLHPTTFFYRMSTPASLSTFLQCPLMVFSSETCTLFQGTVCLSSYFLADRAFPASLPTSSGIPDFSLQHTWQETGSSTSTSGRITCTLSGNAAKHDLSPLLVIRKRGPSVLNLTGIFESVSAMGIGCWVKLKSRKEMNFHFSFIWVMVC